MLSNFIIFRRVFHVELFMAVIIGIYCLDDCFFKFNNSRFLGAGSQSEPPTLGHARGVGKSALILVESVQKFLEDVDLGANRIGRRSADQAAAG